MAFLKFGKKKREEMLDIPLPPMDTQPETQSSPVEQVMSLNQQGYSNNQIVQALQNQGYNNSQIYDAINQANLAGPQSVEQPEVGMQDYGQAYQSYQQPQQSPQPAKEYESAGAAGSSDYLDDERIQEIAESIIDEKWEEFAGDIRKVIEWKGKSEDRLSKIEQQILDLRMSIDSLTKSIMSKISTYDQNIVDVGTEIKAMEKVFQKVLPTLTENVNKLDRMTKGYKEPQQKNK